MKQLLAITIIGFFAQLVDGALGMSYGLTSTTLLLSLGLAPALASASVHFSEIFTTLASASMHITFKNVDWRSIRALVPSGMVGAFLGALTLSYAPVHIVAPLIAIFLCVLGVYIFLKTFVFLTPNYSKPMSAKGLSGLGFLGGFFDASGGGGWGPICTPVLLSRKHLETRKVIGTVDTSEFLIACSASVGFILALGAKQIPWNIVFLFIIGGVIAAPLAAYLVRIVPEKPLTLIVSLAIIGTNVKALGTQFLWTNSMTLSVLLLLLCLLSVTWLLKSMFRTQ
ncbi:MAG: sulfite exporter TauE/SafE family protein [Bacilli bacterium]